MNPRRFPQFLGPRMPNIAEPRNYRTLNECKINGVDISMGTPGTSYRPVTGLRLMHGAPNDSHIEQMSIRYGLKLA